MRSKHQKAIGSRQWAVVTLLCLAFASVLSAGETPIGASVRVTNGNTSGSGTVFCVSGEKAFAIGAAHCFVGRIGGEFDCLINGATVKARLLAIDKGKDLALWDLPASAVTVTAELPKEQPSGSMTAVGHPAGVAEPHLKKLKFRDQHELAARFEWRCELLEGRFEGGDSGGGVFLGGKLAGVIHGIERRQVCEGKTCRIVTYLHAVSFHDVREFLSASQVDLAACDGKKSHQEPYDGAGPRPKDLDSDKGMACEIDKLRREVADLKSQISNLKSSPGPPGPKVTAAELDAAIAQWVEDHGEQWLADHSDKLKGPAGASGAPGPKGDRGEAGTPGASGKAGAPGRITLILIDAAGNEVSRASDVESGSVVRLQVKRFQK